MRLDRSRLILALLCLQPALACGPNGSAVPFKRGPSGTDTSSAPPSRGSSEPAEARPAVPAEPTSKGEGRSFPTGTSRIELANRTLTLTEGSIRAALDLEDAPSRVLLVTEGANTELALAQSSVGPAGWAPPAQLARLLEPAPERHCALKQAAARTLNASYALVVAELECGSDAGMPGATAIPAIAPQAPVPAPASYALAQLTARPADTPTTAAPAPNAAATAQARAEPNAAPAAGQAPPQPGTVLEEHQLWVATRETTPRVLVHAATSAPPDASGTHVMPDLESRDLDGDGDPDVALLFDVATGDQPATRVEVRFFSRAGGLAQDMSEPEKTLLALVEQAKAERKRNPGAALELARRALAVHAALCRESGTAEVWFDGKRGLECGASIGAGRAAAIVAAALASGGKLLDALAALDAMRQPAYRVTDADLERARAALRAKVEEHAYTFRAGPALEPSLGPHVRRAAIAFIDESHLLLRGPTARSYDLASGALEPIGVPAETSIVDPSGQLAISRIVRTCDGYALALLRSGQIVAGVVTGPSVAEALFVRAEPPPEAHCPEPRRSEREDDGGFRVLDWVPSGVLLARAERLWLLPLDASGVAIGGGPARALRPDEGVSGLVRSGELTPDARFIVVPTSLGIAIHERKSGATRLVAAPEADGPIGDVAISPSARVLAVTRAGRVFIGEPALPPQPVAAKTPAVAPGAPPAPATPPAPAPPASAHAAASARP